MKNVSLIGSAALILVLGSGMSTRAQEAPKQEEKPAESKAPAEKPAAKPQESKPPTHTKQKPEQPKTASNTSHAAKSAEAKPEAAPAKTESAKTETEHKPPTKPANTNHDTSHAKVVQTRAQQDAHKQDASHNADAQHHAENGHGRIPDEKYHSNFGREHTFHISRPVVVEGRSRFDYGGYSFAYAQAWPSGWGYGDELYIVDINGVYYLMDATHPGPQLEVEVIL